MLVELNSLRESLSLKKNIVNSHKTRSISCKFLLTYLSRVNSNTYLLRYSDLYYFISFSNAGYQG